MWIPGATRSGLRVPSPKLEKLGMKAVAMEERAALLPLAPTASR